MRSRAVAAPFGVALLVLAATELTACSQATGRAATSADRAACAQLERAYSTVNASPVTPDAPAVYRRAIALATRADNRRLGTAIAAWVTAMQRPTATAVPGASYAASECRSIGIPLQVHVAATVPSPAAVAGTGPASGSTTSNPGAGDGPDSEDHGGD
jgi:hypothetical protein